jgi:peptidoglycan hydrolase CwlO-like protein
MPLSHEINTPHHQVKINQSLIKEVKNDVIELRKDLDNMNEKITFIYNYIVKKKEKEDARWF